MDNYAKPNISRLDPQNKIGAWLRDNVKNVGSSQLVCFCALFQHRIIKLGVQSQLWKSPRAKRHLLKVLFDIYAKRNSPAVELRSARIIALSGHFCMQRNRDKKPKTWPIAVTNFVGFPSQFLPRALSPTESSLFYSSELWSRKACGIQSKESFSIRRK